MTEFTYLDRDERQMCTCEGLIAVTALKWWCNPETLMPGSRELLDAQGLVKVLEESLDRSGDGEGARVSILVTSGP